MTLGAILLVSIFCAHRLCRWRGTRPLRHQLRRIPRERRSRRNASLRATPQTPPADPACNFDAGNSNKKPAAATPRRKKKQVTRTASPGSDACHFSQLLPRVNYLSAAASDSEVYAQDPAHGGTAPDPAIASAPTDCPPSKVIVRQGGTSEPSIQLAGRGQRQARTSATPPIKCWRPQNRT